MPIDPSHRVVLIRIPRAYRPGMGSEALYEATRKWWRMNPRRDPDWAFAIVGNRVLAVYRIDGWERSGDSRRWGFHGAADDELERRYVGDDVSDHFRRGAQNPIRYVNC